MESFELYNYIANVSDYIEYSFYDHSAEIMDAISINGFENVFQIITSDETKKGVYKCKTTWEVGKNNTITKHVNIDISGEVIYITEILTEKSQTQSTAGVAASQIDIEKEYADVLKLLRKKSLNSIEKGLFLKVVKAFFED